ncbi:MAG: hypothetical protein ACRC33_07725 [Gemmataceae bacterium]
MREAVRFGAVVLLAAFLALPASEARAQKKKKDGPIPSDKVDGSKLASGKYAGVLRSTPDADRAFWVELSVAGGKKVTVEFQMAEKAKVRTNVLPAAFDDKGNPKKYTAKERDEMRGPDRALGGYESAVEQLGNGQGVQVTLAPAPKPAPAGKKKGDDEARETVEKPKQVKLILILSVPEGGEGGAPTGKKK